MIEQTVEREETVVAQPERVRRARRVPRSVVYVGAVLAFAGLVALLTVASRHAFAGNSDDATLVLEGQALAHGHLALSGWNLSLDSFWTLDAPFYALWALVLGLTPMLVHIVPAFIAALVVVAAVVVAREGRRGRAAFVGAAVAVALLALPGPDLSYYLLQSGWHAATALCCLLAFAAISRPGSRRALVVATLLLAAGLLGDLLSLTLGVIPILVAGFVAARRLRSWRPLLRYASAVVGAVAIAFAVRRIALLFGTYSIGSRSILATSSQMVDNVKLIPDRLLALFGVTSVISNLSSTPLVLRIVRGAVTALVVVAFLVALGAIVRALVGRSSRAASFSQEWRINDLLAIAIVGDLVSFVVFATVPDFSLARYLVPGFIFAAVLAGRSLTGRLRLSSPLPLRRAVVAALAVVALCGVDFGLDSLGSAAPLAADPLGTFLAAHNLHSGVGDYWSSSIVTVSTKGAVVVRPVVLDSNGTLVPYNKQSADSWYKGQRFSFFVYDTSNVWQNVTATAAEKSFGKPATTYGVGTYVVLVFTTPIAILSG